MMNPFSQRIGIFYTELEWANDIFDKIFYSAEDYIDFRTGNVVKLKYSMRITFLDGSTVELLPAKKEYIRGKRFTKSFIQNTVSKEIYQNEILPTNTWYDCWIISDYNDLFTFGHHYRPEEYYKIIDKLCEVPNNEIKS